MCTSPITVPNPIKKPVYGIDKHYLTVPCGHCWECRQRKRNDYFVRAFFEHLNTQTKHGFSYFQTNTYNDKYLPKYYYYSRETLEYKYASVFDSSHVRKYLDRVKTKLRRIYGKDVVNNNVRYLLTSEYGSDRDYFDEHDRLRHATHRPHYHLIWFVATPKIDRWLFRKISLECWSYGRSYDSNVNNGFLNGLGAIKYVTKYVSKDIDSVEKINAVVQDMPPVLIPKYVELASNFIRLSSSQTKSDGTYIQSFGECALNKDKNGNYIYSHYVNDELLKDGFICTPDKDHIIRKYPLPMFYERKLFYDKFVDVHFDEDGNKKYSGLYYLNDKGREVKLHRLDRHANAIKLKVQQVLCFQPTKEQHFLRVINKRLTKKFKAYEEVRKFFRQVETLPFPDTFYKSLVVYRGFQPYVMSDYVTKITPVEDYEELLSFDRNKHTLEDFSPSGVQYQDLVNDIQYHSWQFENEFVKTLGVVFDEVIKSLGHYHETEHLIIERATNKRNKYLKSLKT